MKLSSNTEILEAADQIIDTLQKDKEVQKKLAGIGFPKEKILEGTTLKERALSMQDAKEEYYNEQWAISQQINTDMEGVVSLFKEHVQIARIAFRKEPGTLRSLKIQKFAKGTWNLIRQAENFYNNLSYRKSEINNYGVTKEILEQGRTSVEALLSAKRERTRNKGLAQSSTKRKQKAYADLKLWVINFRTIARFAFRDNPQLLESFGIVVPSSAKQ